MNHKKLYLIGVGGGIVLAMIIILIMRTSAPQVPTLPGDTAQLSGWQVIVPENQLFHARFPTVPEYARAELALPDSDMTILQEVYSSTDEEDNSFMVATFVYPAPFDQDRSNELLLAALEGMVGVAEGNELLASELTEFKGHPSLSFVITDQTGYVYQGALLIRDRILYQTFVSYLAGNLDEGVYVQFLNSFEPTFEPAVI